MTDDFLRDQAIFDLQKRVEELENAYVELIKELEPPEETPEPKKK